MKRRDFLSVTAGSVVGAMIPALARAQAKPCPPATFSVGGETSIQTECTPPGDAPSWFVDLPERQWYACAQGAGERLVDVFHGAALGFGGSFSGMPKAWTGGCVDQGRGELIFAANGGHADYAGNEVYACSIRSERPRWYRLTDPSPASVVSPVPCREGSATASTSNLPDGQGFDPSGYAAMFLDGRMRAVHGWNSCIFANDKIWYAHQSSPSGNGYSTPHAWAFNRTFTGIPTSPGGRALAWTKDAGPWAWLGTSDTGAKEAQSRGEQFGVAPPSALDPVTGKIWTAHATTATRVWSSLDTRSGVIKRSDVVNGYANNTGQDGRWAVVVVDPSGQDRWRIWVAPAPDAKGLVALNLKASNPYAAAAWTVYPVSDLAAISAAGLGAVYHKASKSIILGNPLSLKGGQLLKLRVPTNADGTFNVGGRWEVSSLAPATSSSADPTAGTSTSNNGAWSKFNLIEDMGNGQSALVVCMEVDQPTYVYKLPVQGV